jgi:hypothetical protein
MKLKSILTCGLGVLALTACNDYLEVDSPSKYSIEDVFSSQKDAGQALNGVYASILTNNCFGQAYTYSLILNTDVDYVSNSRESKQSNTPQRYDCDANSSTVSGVWNATWTAIENANNFVYNLKNGSIYDEKNEEVMQMMGEAKVIRAMLYYELLCYWGDVPFTFEPTSATEDFAPAITSRDEIAKALVEDLAEIAPKMKFAADISEGIERASKEACWAMIARIALQASGYSLRHNADDAASYGYMGKPSAADEQWFLEKARLYADSVIASGTHSLKKDYMQVFYDECNMTFNNEDDPIFELPFAIEASGTIGYRQGPAFNSNAGETNYQWGECSGGQYLESFYRYSFAEGDARKYVGEGFWYYDYQGTPILRASYGLHNLKWSKIWNTTSAYTKISTNNTGINYPYLRYADVLLMYAEADVKLTHTVNARALASYNEVRERAFRNAAAGAPAVAITDEASFVKAILDERKWEFAGENMRWKDLVRNNQLAENVYWTFMRNWAVAEDAGVGVTWGDNVEEHDGVEYFDDRLLPNQLTYIYIKNPAKNKLDLDYYQNTTLPCLYILNKERTSNELKTTDDVGTQIHSAVNIRNNPQLWFDDYNLPYTAIKKPNDESIDKVTWTEKADFFSNWYDEDGGYPKAQVRYSLYGYIRGGVDAGDYGNIYLIDNGTPRKIEGGQILTDYPVIRYILPIPREALRRGGYTNYYGY